jgi:hypothetical protein
MLAMALVIALAGAPPLVVPAPEEASCGLDDTRAGGDRQAAPEARAVAFGRDHACRARRPAAAARARDAGAHPQRHRARRPAVREHGAVPARGPRGVAGLRPDPESDALYGTTDPIANWYKRNLRMFTNVYRIAEPRERILLVVGSGHGAILRRLATDAPDVCLVDVARVLE